MPARSESLCSLGAERASTRRVRRVPRGTSGIETEEGRIRSICKKSEE
jgi:hypothetical protein